MARPKKQAHERTRPLYARFKADEIELIEAAAAAEDLPLASYIHRATMAYTRDSFDFDSEGA
jgi:uncharacterized protein (DUF1778 family)